MESSHRDAEAELNLPPGFRFHPTDDELVVHYLSRRAAHQRLPVPIIAEVDLYKFDPWDLPEKALFGQREWYFFTPRDRKYPNGSRPNRAAGKGYWKATGADKPVTPPGYPRPLGIKKALVFYHGKAPKGVKTDWIMHEYRLADTNRAASNKSSLRLDEWVLCRLYNKKNAWEKMRKPSVETSESMQTGSESIWTPESEVDHESVPDLADLGYQNMAKPKEEEIVPDFGDLGRSEVYRAKPPKEEENDWFMGLNLDDLQGGYMGFGSEAAPGLDMPMPMPGQEYYFPQLDLSPQMRLNDSLPPF